MLLALGCLRIPGARPARAESVPGERLRIGNTNSLIRFTLPPAAWINAWCQEGPTHHGALGVGHVANRLEKIASLVDLQFKLIGG